MGSAVRLVCAAVIWGLLLLGHCPAFAAVPVDILRFNALVDISAEGKLTVTEKIVVAVPISGANHGLFRDIPINPRWKEKGRQQVSLKVLSVYIDGRPYAADDIDSQWPFVRIYMRDKEKFLSAGEHTFVLKYHITQQVGFFGSQDELTWNVTGSGWEGIGGASCIVLPPPGAVFTDHRAWLGLRGAQDSPVQTTATEVNGRKGLLFKAERAMLPGEDFTVAVAWPKGFCTAPDISRPEDATGFTLGLFALLLASSAFAWLIWRKFGKDPNTGPVIPQFYPPKLPPRLAGKERKGQLLSAAAANYLWNKSKLTPRGLAGLFISLAERGDCTILGDATSGFTIRRVRSTSPVPEEAAVTKHLGNELHLDKEEDGKALSTINDVCRAQLDRDYRGSWKQNLMWSALTFVPPLLGLFLLLCWELGPIEQWPDDFTLAIGTGVLSTWFVLSIFYCAYARRGCLRIFLMLLGAVLAVVFIGLLYVLLFSESEGLLWLFSPLQLLLMGATLGVPVAFAPLMDAPSLETAKLRQEIAGLAMYIGTAETGRLNATNPPDKPLELYHRLLPYAVALELEEAWGARFAQELAAVEASENSSQFCLTSPHALYALTRDTSTRLTSYAAAQASSRSEGSSFGGGGGGAGSGGGGGGGGAC